MKKKHLVLAALVLALGAAVYLNWQFAPSEKFIDMTSENRQEQNIGDAQYVATASQDVSAADADAQMDDEALETAKKNTFLDDARADREKTRKEAVDTLKDIISDPSLSESQKSEAVSTGAKIAERMEQEAAIETLIRAKGYSDCVTVIGDTQVNVIVPSPKDGLTSADAAIIRDIVMGQINISPNCIKIIEAK